MNLAKIICIEGLDASGKSTQINFIKKFIEDKNLKCDHIHFPMYGNNEASTIISSYLRGEYGDIDNVNPVFVAQIFALDRYLFLPELKKKMLKNDIIIMDRYVFSSMAFRGANYDTETESKIMRDWINDLEFGFYELPYPDLTLFLDVPIETIESRLNQERIGDDREYLNGKKDIHEKDISYQNKVRYNYMQLKQYTNYHIIEAKNLNPENLFNTYEDLIKKLLYAFKHI